MVKINVIKPFVSIIIPVKEINHYIRESIPFLLNQKYDKYEIIILPDERTKESFPSKVRIINTGKIGPATKRNIGVQKAKGEIIAFIDDDAYPKDNKWIQKGVDSFFGYKIGAVGGPNLTPSNDGEFERVTGDVLASWMGSGPANIRYKEGKTQYADDLPTCNFFVRKKDFEKVKGFNSEYWPGEDTKLCSDFLANKIKILYNQKLQVYHHRRKGWKNYARQVFRYSLHRGYFIKRIGGNSLKFAYFIPSFFLVGLFAGIILSIFYKSIFIIYITCLTLYALLILLEAIRSQPLEKIPLFAGIIFLTHILYGVGIISGLCKRSLISNLKPSGES